LSVSEHSLRIGHLEPNLSLFADEKAIAHKVRPCG